MDSPPLQEDKPKNTGNIGDCKTETVPENKENDSNGFTFSREVFNFGNLGENKLKEEKDHIDLINLMRAEGLKDLDALKNSKFKEFLPGFDQAEIGFILGKFNFVKNEDIMKLLPLVNKLSEKVDKTIPDDGSFFSTVTPYEIRKLGDKNYIFLPSNNEELVKNNILLQLYIRCAIALKYISFTMDVKASSKGYNLTADNIKVIEGFTSTINFEKNELKKYKEGGHFTKLGINCAAHYVAKKNKVTSILFKFNGSKTLGTLLDKGFEGKDIKGKLLPLIINYVRDLSISNIMSFLKSQDEIKKVYGIDADFKSTIFIKGEVDLISTHLYSDIKRIIESIDIIKSTTSYNDVVKWCADIDSVLPDWRKFKNYISAIQTDRYNMIIDLNSKKKKKTKKMPMIDIKRSAAKENISKYDIAFNPIRVFKINFNFPLTDIDGEPLKSTFIQQEITKITINLSDQTKYKLHKDVITLIKNYYDELCSLIE